MRCVAPSMNIVLTIPDKKEVLWGLGYLIKWLRTTELASIHVY